MKQFLLALLGLFSCAAWAAEPAGNVVFTVGAASILHAGASTPLKRGDAVMAGDTLETGANGYIQIRTVDQGFISLRPSSRLIIEQYRYDPSNPRNNAIKYLLQAGVMRSVTGQGGEAAKDRFRLNTPVAAIGIRGTDFSVYTTSQETRVNILRGGVAVSPLNANCQAASFGPCNGASVLNLFAGNLDQVLQVHQHDVKPLLIQDGRKLAPDTVAPALPEEKDNVPSGASAVKPSSQSTIAALLPSDSTLADVTQSPSLIQPASPPGPPVPPPVLARIEWGRWGSGPNSGNDLLTPDRELIDLNSLYVLTRTRDTMALPEKGVFDFNLTGAEAGITNYGVKVDSATVSNGALQVDFGKGTYATSLTVTAPTLPAAVALSSSNSVGRDGKFGGNLVNGNMSVSGALSGDGTSAGYLFTSPLNDGRVVEGVTSWKKR